MTPLFTKLCLFCVPILAFASQAQALISCGTKGSVQERIQDCKKILGRTAEVCVWRGGHQGQTTVHSIDKTTDCDFPNLSYDTYTPPSIGTGIFHWSLVTRLSTGQEVWLDQNADMYLKKKLLWADASPPLTAEEARTYCQDHQKGKLEKGGLDLDFIAPLWHTTSAGYLLERDDMTHAFRHGMQNVVPHMAGNNYWVLKTYRAPHLPPSGYESWVELAGRRTEWFDEYDNPRRKEVPAQELPDKKLSVRCFAIVN